MADLIRVSKVERSEQLIVLSIASTTWKESFHSIDVSFGARDHTLLEKRSGLQPRQASQTSTTSAITSSVPFPSLPSSQPTQTSVHGAGLNLSWNDVQILPPSFPGIANSSLLAASLPPPGMTLKCRNCSLSGNADITHGLLTSSGPVNSSNTTENAIQFFHEGYIELAAYFDAHVEIESIVVPSASLVSYIAPFPDIDILGFTIPFIAEVGVVFRPKLTFGVEIATQLNFTYGFALDIPRNSNVILDVHNSSNSNVTGFQQTRISALPFQAEVDSVNLTIAAAFTPELLLTIGILDNAISANAGAFLDLPKLEATVAQVNHVNETCDPVSPAENIKDYIFDSLTNIVPSIEVDVGVLAEMDEKFSGNKENGVTYTAWNNTWTLPTACYSFDSAQKAYVTPTQTTAPTTTPTAKGPGSNSGPDSNSKSGTSGLRPIEIFPSGVPSFFAVVIFFSVVCLA